MKSKVLILMMCLILSGMAMLGCSNGSEEGNVPELAGVSFGFMEGSEKVISISREALSYNELYWSYRAAWKGDAGVTPMGAQSEMKAVKDGAGLAELGGFTPGSWEFELFGYSDSGRTKLVFSGTSGGVALSAGLTAPVTVVVDYSATGTGTIKLGSISFKEGTEYTLESITVDGEAKALDADDQLTNIAAGNHTVYLKYSGTGGYYEAKVLVTVSAGVTTIIEGQLDLLVAAAPTGLAGEKPSYYGQTDGKITGLNSTKLYEYSMDGNTWNLVAANSTAVTGLAAGVYKVRLSGEVRSGTAVDVTVPAGDFRVTLCAGEGIGDDTYVYVEAGTDNYPIPECPGTFIAPKIPVGAVNGGEDIPFKAWNDGTIDITSATIELNDNIILTAQWAKPLFSVSDTKKVYFAKGNLQATYNGSSYTWGFAANQNEYVGGAAGNTTIDSQASGAKVDLFGWSTASTNYGINNSEVYGTYSGNFVDWGTAIDNAGTWHTLSASEWQYLYNTPSRMINNKPCYSNAVSGVSIGGETYKGIFLYPDDYNGDIVSDSMTWEQINATGIVFLPAAGLRSGSSLLSVDDIGYYWSSTAYDSTDVYFLDFNSGSANVHCDYRYSGLSVRLVCGE